MRVLHSYKQKVRKTSNFGKREGYHTGRDSERSVSATTSGRVMAYL